jgi:hypothetical protein
MFETMKFQIAFRLIAKSPINIKHDSVFIPHAIKLALRVCSDERANCTIKLHVEQKKYQKNDRLFSMFC